MYIEREDHLEGRVDICWGGEREQMSPQHFECKSFWHLCIVSENFRMSLFWQPGRSHWRCNKGGFMSVVYLHLWEKKNTTNQSIHQLNIGLLLLSIVIYMCFNSRWWCKGKEIQTNNSRFGFLEATGKFSKRCLLMLLWRFAVSSRESSLISSIYDLSQFNGLILILD